MPRGWSRSAVDVPILETAGGHPEKDRGVKITVNYKKLNQISTLSQLPIPRVDQVLGSLGSGRVFSLFDLVFFVPPHKGA